MFKRLPLEKASTQRVLGRIASFADDCNWEAPSNETGYGFSIKLYGKVVGESQTAKKPKKSKAAEAEQAVAISSSSLVEFSGITLTLAGIAAVQAPHLGMGMQIFDADSSKDIKVTLELTEEQAKDAYVEVYFSASY